MYKLLLATDDPAVRTVFQSIENWHGMGFHTPVVKDNAQAAIDHMESHGVDAIGYCLEKDQAKTLQNYLTSTRPSMPIFQIRRHVATQVGVLQEVRRVLDFIFFKSLGLVTTSSSPSNLISISDGRVLSRVPLGPFTVT